MLKFQGIDGKEYQLDPKTFNHPLKSKEACKSNIQWECGQYLKQKFPFTPILEELYVPGHAFYFDFFLPTFQMVFEIDGGQHEKYTPFFHKSEKLFAQAKMRDKNKKYLCEINKWTLHRIKSLDELKSILG